MKFIYHIFLCQNLLFATNICSQTTTLNGIITNRNKEPIAGATVDFCSGYIRTTSDKDGMFLFTYSDTLKNRYIRFNSLGYKAKTMIVNKGQTEINVILVDSLHSLQGITVSAPKYGRFSDYSAQTIQMSAFDIVTNPSAMADIIGNMRALPGIQTNDNDGRLIIQGGNPDESQIYINDLIIMNPYHLSSRNSGVRSRFSPDLFEGIVLQSGGFNAEFGQALSGIVNLNTKEKDSFAKQTDVSVSSVFAEISLMDNKESYAYRASVNYTDLTPYSRLVPDNYDWNKYYRHLSGDFFIIKHLSEKTKITSQTNFNFSGLDYTFRNVDNVAMSHDLEEKYFYTQLNLYHAFNEKFSLSVAGNLIIDEFRGTDLQRKSDRVESVKLWNHNKINLQYTSYKIVNRTGIEYINNPLRETYTLDKKYDIRIKNGLTSLYNDTKFYLTNNLSMNIGLRGEYSDYLKQLNLAPRLYVGYRLKREHIVSASVGEYFQLPSTDYLKYDNSMDFTSVTKGTISYSYVEKVSKLQLDAYYKKYKNAVTYSEEELIPVDFNNEGDGYGFGANLFWKSNFKQLEYWFTYSYNKTMKKYGLFGEKTAPPYVSPHSLNITLKYWVSPLMSLFGCSYNIASGTPYYNNQYPYNELGTTPFRNRMDISWSFLPKQWIIIHFGCQNLFGYKNVYGYQYSQTNHEIKEEIASPAKRFLFVGVFITFSNDRKSNQLKSL